MKRREFIALLGGSVHFGAGAAAGPHAGPEGQPRIAAFSHTLQALGWADGRNIQTEIRWTKGPEDIGKYVLELVRLAPDLI